MGAGYAETQAGRDAPPYLDIGCLRDRISGFIGHPFVKPAFRRFVGWNVTLLIGLLCAEFLLGYYFQISQVAWVYPRWSDQIQYLTEAYSGFEVARSRGFLAAAWTTLTNGSAQGTLHDFWALLIFEIAGPSRAHALALNLGALLAWQGVTFFAVFRVWRRWDLAWTAIALQAATAFPWAGEAGSVIDFRLDWMATCAYGAALAVAVVAAQAKSYRWYIASGFAVSLVLLTRFLTAVYFGLGYSFILVWLAASRERRGAIAGTLLSGMIAAVIAGPIFWINRQYIYNYYWVGHVTGPERLLRDSHLNALTSLNWVVEGVLRTNLGLPVCALALGAAILYILLSDAAPPTIEEASPIVGRLGPASALLIGVYALAPALVLWFHPVKAPPPLAIVIGPAIWVIIALWEKVSCDASRKTRKAVFATVLVSATVIFATRVSRRPFTEKVYDDAKKVSALVDYILFRADEAGLAMPRLGATLNSDILNAGALNVLGYERHAYWPGLVQTLPTGLYGTSAHDIIRALGQSDFILLLEKAGVTFPFDRDALAALPEGPRVVPAAREARGALRNLTALTVEVFERGLTCLRRRGVLLPESLHDVGRLMPCSGATKRCSPPVSGLCCTTTTHLLLPVGRHFSEKLDAGYRPVTFKASALPARAVAESGGNSARHPWPRATIDHRPARHQSARINSDVNWTLVPSAEEVRRGRLVSFPRPRGRSHLSWNAPPSTPRPS